MQWFNWTLIGLGVGIVCDGIGSVLVRGEQYHNAWFDGERYVRAGAGILIIILGAIIR